MIYWNSPFPHNECDRTYPTISPVKLLQLSVHVLLPPQRFEVDEAAILFLSFSVMEEKKFLINLIHSDTTRFKTKRPTHRTQFSFGWSFPFVLSIEAFTLKAGELWVCNTLENNMVQRKKTKPNQNLMASHWHDNLQSLTLLLSYLFCGLSTGP